jgi:hypothetical protein
MNSSDKHEIILGIDETSLRDPQKNDKTLNGRLFPLKTFTLTACLRLFEV